MRVTVGRQAEHSPTVLVTGGAGFLGSNLVGHLLNERGKADSCKVVVLDSYPDGLHPNLQEFSSNPNLEVIHGDVRDNKLLACLTAGVDQIYHLSSIVGVDKYCEDPLEVIDVNITGTRLVLECALDQNVPVLFTSTSEIFGKNPEVPWKEDDDRVLGSTNVDRWCYSSSKAVCEHMIFALVRNSGLRCSIVRFFNVYGPKQNPTFVVSQGVHRVLNGQPPLTYDSGEQTRCFTHVSDAVKGMVLVANSEEAIGQVFNIGSDVPTAIKDVNRIIIEEAGLADSIDSDQVDTQAMYGERYEDIERRVPDVSKALNELNWKAKVPLREGINGFIGWAQTKQNAWWLQ